MSYRFKVKNSDRRHQHGKFFMKCEIRKVIKNTNTETYGGNTCNIPPWRMGRATMCVCEGLCDQHAYATNRRGPRGQVHRLWP